MPVLNTVLRRRMLLLYLLCGFAMYTLAILAAFGQPDARGEWVAAGLCAIGVLAAFPGPLHGWRYIVALLCACIAPLAPVLAHVQPAAQVWALIPLILITVFVRSWHRTAVARALGAVLATALALGLWVAPAPVPPLWFVLFPVCILGAAELLGVLHAALVEAALRDPLTGVWNRAGLHRELDGLLPRARRRGESLAVIVLDIDDFKSVNDRDGHAAGDAVLMHLTRRWARQLPASAIVGRIGGDEFVAVIADCTAEQARALAVRLSGGGPVHVSTGISVGQPSDAAEFADMLSDADRDCYRLKNHRKSCRSPAATAGDIPTVD